MYELMHTSEDSVAVRVQAHRYHVISASLPPHCLAMFRSRCKVDTLEVLQSWVLFPPMRGKNWRMREYHPGLIQGRPVPHPATPASLPVLARLLKGKVAGPVEPRFSCDCNRV